MSKHILFAYELSGPRKGQALTDEAAIIDALKAPELAWLHLRARHEKTADWMRAHLGWLDPLALRALLAEETRPRATPTGEGVLVVLRGVNLNPGEDPEDMVSIRLYVDQSRIVSVAVRDLMSVADLRDQVAAGQGPEKAGAFLCRLIERLNDRIESVIHSIDEECDAIEEALIDGGQDGALRSRIAQGRRQVILLRRHIAPQRDALTALAKSGLPIFETRSLRALGESIERLTRAIEEIDALRDRLGVVRDELQNALSERLNRNLYILSVISVVFLPISFLTGLLGINVGGIPGAENHGAFWIVCAGLVGIVVAVLALMRRLRWI